MPGQKPPQPAFVGLVELVRQKVDGGSAVGDPDEITTRIRWGDCAQRILHQPGHFHGRPDLITTRSLSRHGRKRRLRLSTSSMGWIRVARDGASGLATRDFRSVPLASAGRQPMSPARRRSRTGVSDARCHDRWGEHGGDRGLRLLAGLPVHVVGRLPGAEAGVGESPHVERQAGGADGADGRRHAVSCGDRRGCTGGLRRKFSRRQGAPTSVRCTQLHATSSSVAPTFVLRNGLNHRYGDEEPRAVQQRIADDVVGSVESIRKSNKNCFITLTAALRSKWQESERSE